MHRREFVLAAATGAAALRASARTGSDGQAADVHTRLVVDGLDTSVMNEGFLSFPI
jgi:hypothetical protein